MKDIKTLFGKPLSTNNRRLRMKTYAMESLVVAIVMFVIDLLCTLVIKNYGILHVFKNNTINYIFTFSLNSFLVFIMIFCLDFIINERRFNKSN